MYVTSPTHLTVSWLTAPGVTHLSPDIPVIPIDFEDCEDWLAAYGFFGKTSRFLPASENIKVYAKDKLFTVEDIQFTYVITDGHVTAISQKIENTIISFNLVGSSEYEIMLEWK